jgi:hypothetical protein
VVGVIRKIPRNIKSFRATKFSTLGDGNYGPGVLFIQGNAQVFKQAVARAILDIAALAPP